MSTKQANTKQQSPASKNNSSTGGRRGVKPGDKVVARRKTRKPAGHITPGGDLLTAISRPHYTKPRTPLATKSVVNPIREAFDKAGVSVLGVAKSKQWDDDSKRQAHAYLKQLFFGPIDDQMVAGLLSDVKRTVEMRFATGCYFARYRLKNIQLPGMSSENFQRDFASAEKRFGKPVATS